MSRALPRPRHYSVVINRDNNGRKMACVCPHCKRSMSEGYFFLELREDFVSKDKSSVGALGLDIPISPVCCGEIAPFVKFHKTLNEAISRCDRLNNQDRRRLSHVRVTPVQHLVPIGWRIQKAGKLCFPAFSYIIPPSSSSSRVFFFDVFASGAACFFSSTFFCSGSIFGLSAFFPPATRSSVVE